MLAFTTVRYLVVERIAERPNCVLVWAQVLKRQMLYLAFCIVFLVINVPSSERRVSKVYVSIGLLGSEMRLESSPLIHLLRILF